MKKCAIIIDSRPSKELDEIIDKHMAFLPGWDLRKIDNIKISNGHDYNRILTNPSFWSVLPYDKVLIFQHDSLLLREGIDEFLEYDFIGAPIDPVRNFPFPAMNGGLSLRTPKAMIECLDKKHISTTRYANHNEDIYFSYICNGLGFNIPDFETARMFSVETIYGLGSLGLHQIDSYLTKEQCQQIRTQYE